MNTIVKYYSQQGCVLCRIMAGQYDVVLLKVTASDGCLCSWSIHHDAPVIRAPLCNGDPCTMMHRRSVLHDAPEIRAQRCNDDLCTMMHHHAAPVIRAPQCTSDPCTVMHR